MTHAARLDPGKFRDPRHTARGEPRAGVALSGLRTLWFNTGTLCNMTCARCYIESSPSNDSLSYLSAAEVARYLDEVEALGLDTREIGFTGGEPFLNRDLTAMLDDALDRGRTALVLTNAMRPMRLHEAALLRLRDRHGDRLTLRVSLDHHTAAVHEAERGRLVLFPEMDAAADVPEITEACWGILGRSPGELMCASSRMVVKRRGQAPSVVACTLTPHAPGFDLGPTLRDAAGTVMLNHPHCARFCMLGGASCSG